MQSSVFLAQLIGPVMLVAVIGLLIRPENHRTMVLRFLESPPLIYFTGVLSMVAGVAIVLNHNIWTTDWRVIVTVLGWLLAIGGALRILFFGTVEKAGTAMLRKPRTLRIGGLVWFGISAVLCFFGYFAKDFGVESQT